MKIYTRGGDDGQTAFFGGQRVTKAHARIRAYGEVDELNCVLGLARAACVEDLAPVLERESGLLFTLGAHLATPGEAAGAREHLPAWPSDAVRRLELEIDAWDQELPTLRSFVLPGGTELAARLHLARAVCRRAERAVVALIEEAGSAAVQAETLHYLNRLSDWLFTAARVANHRAGVADHPWVPAGT